MSPKAAEQGKHRGTGGSKAWPGTGSTLYKLWSMVCEAHSAWQDIKSPAVLHDTFPFIIVLAGCRRAAS